MCRRSVGGTFTALVEEALSSLVRSRKINVRIDWNDAVRVYVVVTVMVVPHDMIEVNSRRDTRDLE